MYTRRTQSVEHQGADGRIVMVRITEEHQTVRGDDGSLVDLPLQQTAVIGAQEPVKYIDEGTFETLDGERLTRL